MIEFGISYPPIKPVSAERTRPFWSVMIPTYNCANYLERTLESVLSQDPGREVMHIEVIDDCSRKDDPEEVVNRLGRGRVQFFQQPRNVGASTNFTACIQRSIGHWVHILHGDDEVLPGFYKEYRKIVESYGCSMVIGRSVLIDKDNFWRSFSRPFQKEEGFLEKAQFVLAVGNEVRTPSVVVSRAAYEKVGGFHPDLVHCNDWEMWARLAAHDPVGYIPHPYSLYREHSASDTTKLVASGSDTRDAIQAVQIISSHFHDSAQRAEFQSLAHTWIGFDCLYKGLSLMLAGQVISAIRRLGYAMRYIPLFIKNRRYLQHVVKNEVW